MLGKEGVSTLAGYGASNLVYDKTNNQTLGMIAGILASTGSAKGLNMADAKLGCNAVRLCKSIHFHKGVQS